MTLRSIFKRHDVGQPARDLGTLIAKELVAEDPAEAVKMLAPLCRHWVIQERRQAVRPREQRVAAEIRQHEDDAARVIRGFLPSNAASVIANYDVLQPFRHIWNEKINVDGAEIFWPDATVDQLRWVKQVGHEQIRGLTTREKTLDEAITVCRQNGCKTLREVEKKRDAA